MRANREITAEEYVKRKAETEAELEVLRSIERSDSKIVIDPKALAETIRKLKTALSESASTYDIVEKLVSKIVPEDSSHFNWHIRIDGGEVVLPVESSGRKNFGTVTIHNTWKNK